MMNIRKYKNTVFFNMRLLLCSIFIYISNAFLRKSNDLLRSDAIVS